MTVACRTSSVPGYKNYAVLYFVKPLKIGLGLDLLELITQVT